MHIKLFLSCFIMVEKCCNYSRTSMARTSLGPENIVQDIGSSSHWVFIIVPGQGANSDNLLKSFRFST